MKLFLLGLALILPYLASAQSMDLNKIEQNKDGTTTIQIEKGGDPLNRPLPPKWEIHDGSTDVEGESAATTRDAKAEWKKACDQWKKDFRADNKDNQIVTMNCGHAACSGDAGDKTCTSTAIYKIKTRVQ